MPKENFTYDTHPLMTNGGSGSDFFVADIYRGDRHVMQSPALEKHSDDKPDQKARDWAENWIKRHP